MKGIHLTLGRKIYKNTALIIFLILWEVLPRIGAVPANFLPPLSIVLKEILLEGKEGYLFLNLLLSLYCIMAGLLLATAAGVSAGLVLGYLLPGTAKMLYPLLRLFGQINPYSLLPLFIVFLGIGESAKIAIVAWTAVWPILFHTITGAGSADIEVLKSARAMGAGRFQILRSVILPSAGPAVFDGLRVGVEMAFFVLIAAEMTGGTGGLGAMVHLSGMNFLINKLFASGVCIVILGVMINYLLYDLQKRLFFWKETVRFFQTEKSSGQHKALGAKGIAFIAILCVVILIGGYYQSLRAFRLMNDPGAGEEFNHFFSE